MPSVLRPSIIDVEASGFGVHSYPIEIGVVTAAGKRYSALIKPIKRWTYWCDQAEEVHGIGRDLLMAHGRPIQQVAHELNTLLGRQTAYSDGWVVDAPWIDQLFYEARVRRSFYVSPLEAVLSEEQMAIWHTTKEAYLHDSDLSRHRASLDALVIQETYVRTQRVLQNCHPKQAAKE